MVLLVDLDLASTAEPPVQQQAGHAAAMRAAAADPARPRRRDYDDAPTVPDGAVLQLGGRPRFCEN